MTFRCVCVQEIDGKALMLLRSDMVMKYMGLKLGPALKLCHHIERLKQGKQWTHTHTNTPRAEGLMGNHCVTLHCWMKDTWITLSPPEEHSWERLWGHECLWCRNRAPDRVACGRTTGRLLHWKPGSDVSTSPWCHRPTPQGLWYGSKPLKMFYPLGLCFKSSIKSIKYVTFGLTRLVLETDWSHKDIFTLMSFQTTFPKNTWTAKRCIRVWNDMRVNYDDRTEL